MAKSNLGSYQTMVELAKAADGPVKLGLYVVAGGVLVGGAAVAFAGPLVKKKAGDVARAVRLRASSRGMGEHPRFVISTPAEDEQGLVFYVGDVFVVQADVSGGVLIEILDRSDNPWVVSKELLASISDFPGGA
jgi:hypothetical protein